MNRTGNAIRMAMARLKFKVTDSIHNFVWVVRQSFMFVARLPINIVRIIWFELMGLTFGLRNGIASTLRFFRQFFHLDGLWNLWYALLQTVYHLLRLPRSRTDKNKKQRLNNSRETQPVCMCTRAHPSQAT